MSCNCGSNCCGDGMLAGLMGQLGLPAMWPGDLFKFGFNLGNLRDLSVTETEGIGRLLEAEGLTYNTRSYKLAGYINPFIAIEGASNVYWDSATDLKETIFDLIKNAGYPIQTGSIQFEAETHAEQTEPPTVVRQDDPGVRRDGGGTTPPPPGQCNWKTQSPGDWLACQLGVTTEVAVITGVVIGVGAILLIRR